MKGLALAAESLRPQLQSSPAGAESVIHTEPARVWAVPPVARLPSRESSLEAGLEDKPLAPSKTSNASIVFQPAFASVLQVCMVKAIGNTPGKGGGVPSKPF